MSNILFDGWAGLLRTLLVGVLAYTALVTILRVSGRRTLSKMNAFDWVVTVALGSTLATILLNPDVALAEGVIALGMLVALQYAMTWSSVRVSWVRRLVTGEPMLLLYKGAIIATRLRAARVTDEELRAAIRAAGLAAIEEAEAVVLETDGSFSVIRSESSGSSSLEGLQLPDASEPAG
jgi:uncharacterized membrane protein YcaP (DUF421 family)